VSDKNITKLRFALERNCTLTHLDLSFNKIEDDGATHLAIALQSNTTLKRLNLQCNNIGITGLRALVTALQDNHTLEELKVDNQLVRTIISFTLNADSDCRSLCNAINATMIRRRELLEKRFSQFVGFKTADQVRTILLKNGGKLGTWILYLNPDLANCLSIAFTIQDSDNPANVQIKHLPIYRDCFGYTFQRRSRQVPSLFDCCIWKLASNTSDSSALEQAKQIFYGNSADRICRIQALAPIWGIQDIPAGAVPDNSFPTLADLSRNMARSLLKYFPKKPTSTR
jgi:hypothetical protein